MIMLRFACQRIFRTIASGMNDFYKYGGLALVIAVGGLALYFLARHGGLQSLTSRWVSIVFRTATRRTKQPTDGHRPSSPRVSRDVIRFSSLAREDCEAGRIEPMEVIESILATAHTHPRMFDVAFSSLPHYLRGGAMLLFSWDGKTAIIERIVSRDTIYPLHDEWTHCWALYRRVAVLRYRENPPELLGQSETERTFRLFSQLSSSMRDFDCKRRERMDSRLYGVGEADSLVSEARHALENSDLSTCVSRLEAALGILHKLIVESAPLPKRTKELQQRDDSASECSGGGRRCVLLVDDDLTSVDSIAKILSLSGFDVTVASSVGDGLRHLVNRDFAVVITDLLLPEVDGRELARAIRTSGCGSKVIALTAFRGSADRAGIGTEDFPVDLVLTKPVSASLLLDSVRQVLGA